MFEVYKLDNEENIKKYNSILENVEHLEPYYLLDFIKVFSSGLENLFIFSYKTSIKNSFIVMPAYIKPISVFKNETPFFDFITPYGYTGPLINNIEGQEEIKDFWSKVDLWLAKNKIITQFVRFDLHSNYFHYNGNLVPTMSNIKGKIISEEQQWKNFDHKVRKNVKRSISYNLKCFIYHKKIEEINIQEFYDIYIQTMIRTKAEKIFFYEFKKIKEFIENNQKNVSICTVYFNDKAISSELILVSQQSIYSFLGGTDDKHFDKRPNDFLKFEAINWARMNNKKYYILGGGYGYQDGIFNYKKAFFPEDVVDFYTGRKIINKDIYYDLIQLSNTIRKNNNIEEIEELNSTFFPLYSKNN